MCSSWLCLDRAGTQDPQIGIMHAPTCKQHSIHMLPVVARRVKYVIVGTDVLSNKPCCQPFSRLVDSAVCRSFAPSSLLAVPTSSDTLRSRRTFTTRLVAVSTLMFSKGNELLEAPADLAVSGLLVTAVFCVLGMRKASMTFDWQQR